jgi:ABC-type dipeptide/oligopeptide/nickel transport system ATPase component
MDTILLSVRDLAVYFQLDGSVSRAVDGVSFDIHEGETVCLVGESGCGKSVSALAILGIIPQPPGRITGGHILFNGQNLMDLGE